MLPVPDSITPAIISRWHFPQWLGIPTPAKEHVMVISTKTMQCMENETNKEDLPLLSRGWTWYVLITNTSQKIGKKVNITFIHKRNFRLIISLVQYFINAYLTSYLKYYTFHISLNRRICQSSLKNLQDNKNPASGKHWISQCVRIIAPMSFVTCHMSFVTCHLSLITCH